MPKGKRGIKGKDTIFYLSDKNNNRVTKLSKKLKISRSQFITKLIEEYS